MPPIPASKLTELALSRRKLFEKIMQHVATRKIQNSIQATGARMSVTPAQFGTQLGQQVKKAFGIYGDAMDSFSAMRAGKPMNPLQAGMMRMMNPSLGPHIGDDNVFQNPAQPAAPSLPNLPQMPQMPPATTPTLSPGDHLGIKMLGDQALDNQTPHPMFPGTGQGGLMGGADPYSMKLAHHSTRTADMNKRAFVTLPATAGVGAGLGAITSPSGHRAEGAGRGAAIGAGTSAGMGVGGALGAVGAAALGLLNPRAGKALFGPNKAQLVEAMKRFLARGGRTMMRSGKKVPIRGSGRMSPYTDAMLRNATTRGGIAGLIGGGLGGGALTESALGEPSWKQKQAQNAVVKKSAAAVIARLQKNAGKPIVGGISLDELRKVQADQAKYKMPVQPMSGVAGAMQQVGDTSAKMPTAGVGLLPKLLGKNIGAAAPAVQAAGNKLVAGEKKLAPQATGGVPMFGMLPGLAGNLGRNLGGK